MDVGGTRALVAGFAAPPLHCLPARGCLMSAPPAAWSFGPDEAATITPPPPTPHPRPAAHQVEIEVVGADLGLATQQLGHGPLAQHERRGARGRGQALLRAGVHRVDLPRVGQQRHAAQRGHGVNQQQGAVLAAQRADAGGVEVVGGRRRCVCVCVCG